ncbi:MAG: hypothetical protein QXX71_02595 [Candidatus Nanoarchaeia archaeon]|nr:hypothetical protein [Candidatus Haiyanarchaeum thermophilum]MCW1302781.1 hypothetical protein [Candidatus Haiyanarchaeum thermophilum]MCW1304121.1 hypothetical protein [Candidatus Haiyanarchaeum thermophilum]MCW1307402.1 hypothetical protein [Candidatus Haiyanarchaeum thermophilum]MCW1308018.1 hypothetical protein [Candidatus Haiyanarchaeum thermophilum]
MKFLHSISFLTFLFLLYSPALAQKGEFCLIYFTKVGCPYCAISDPIVLSKWLGEYPKLRIIEYLINDEENSQLFEKYAYTYPKVYPYVPQLIISQENVAIGLDQVVKVEKLINESEFNPCLLLEGQVNFSNLDLGLLPAHPKVWVGNKLILPGSSRLNSTLILELIESPDPASYLDSLGIAYQRIEPEIIPISGGRGIKFEKALRIDDWVIEWNEYGAGKVVELSESSSEIQSYILLIFIILLGLALLSGVLQRKVLKKKAAPKK